MVYYEQIHTGIEESELERNPLTSSDHPVPDTSDPLCCIKPAPKTWPAYYKGSELGLVSSLWGMIWCE